MNVPQDVRHYLSTYVWSISFVLTDLANFKGLLIKIKVIKGFSSKLKDIRNATKLKVSKGFKGSNRVPECRTPHALR